MPIRQTSVFLLSIALTAIPTFAATINFDSLLDSTLVSSQYSQQGIIFSNAIILGSGISLNEFEFPPRSGGNVVSDSGGALTLDFSSAVVSFQGYFTYTTPLTIRAFGAGSVLLGSVQSSGLCSSNLALSGDPGCSANELLALSGIGNIAQITISGSPGGSSFVGDDFDFELAGASSDVPEPATVWTLSLALSAAFFCAKRRIAKSSK